MDLVHPNAVQFYGLARFGKVGMVLELCESDLESYSERFYLTRGNTKPQVGLILGTSVPS